MSYSCSLSTPFSHTDLAALFSTELARSHPRSNVELSGSDFRITAQDTASLRAALNGITSILSVHEKTKKVIDGSR